VSGIVGALARLHTANPRRPLVHLPASGTVFGAGDLWELHLRHVEQLRAAGLQPRQVVVTAVNHRGAFIALTVACRALELVVMPVDAGTTMNEVLGFEERFGAAALVLGADAAAGLGRPWTPLAMDLGLVSRPGPTTPTAAGAAVLKLTSGSIGLPKATLNTEAQLIADARHIIEGMRIGPDDTQLAVIPLSHSYGLSVLLMPLLLQGTPIVARESFVPEQVLADACSRGAVVFPGVPYMFQHFVAHPPAGAWPPRLHKLISAGARLPPETVRDFAAAFGVKIHSFYGASESGGIAYDDGDEIETGDIIGPPLPGVTITLVADDAVPAGSGRIFVRSDAVASGYAGGGDDDCFRDGGFLTGDYGALDDRGRLRLAGRVSSFVNVAGKKVDPGEVERVLRLLSGVRDVHVTSAADARRGEQVVACLVASAGLTAAAVRQFCSTRLAPHKIPRTILFLDGIPRTIRGKVDRRELDRLLAAAGAGPAGAPG
jgi:long-chain acyl-CoA synthetase